MATLALIALTLAFLVAVGRPPGAAVPLRDLPAAVLRGARALDRLAEQHRRRRSGGEPTRASGSPRGGSPRRSSGSSPLPPQRALGSRATSDV